MPEIKSKNEHKEPIGRSEQKETVKECSDAISEPSKDDLHETIEEDSFATKDMKPVKAPQAQETFNGRVCATCSGELSVPSDENFWAHCEWCCKDLLLFETNEKSKVMFDEPSVSFKDILDDLYVPDDMDEEKFCIMFIEKMKKIGIHDEHTGFDSIFWTKSYIEDIIKIYTLEDSIKNALEYVVDKLSEEDNCNYVKEEDSSQSIDTGECMEDPSKPSGRSIQADTQRVYNSLPLHRLLTPGSNKHYVNDRGQTTIEEMEEKFTVLDMIGFAKVNIFKYNSREKGCNEEDSYKVVKYGDYLELLESLPASTACMTVRDALIKANKFFRYIG